MSERTAPSADLSTTENLWLCLPHVKRQRLITVLSHMLENHLSAQSTQEANHESPDH